MLPTVFSRINARVLIYVFGIYNGRLFVVDVSLVKNNAVVRAEVAQENLLPSALNAMHLCANFALNRITNYRHNDLLKNTLRHICVST